MENWQLGKECASASLCVGRGKQWCKGVCSNHNWCNLCVLHISIHSQEQNKVWSSPEPVPTINYLGSFTGHCVLLWNCDLNPTRTIWGWTLGEFRTLWSCQLLALWLTHPNPSTSKSIKPQSEVRGSQSNRLCKTVLGGLCLLVIGGSKMLTWVFLTCPRLVCILAKLIGFMFAVICFLLLANIKLIHLLFWSFSLVSALKSLVHKCLF